jgi:hypothetical protein
MMKKVFSISLSMLVLTLLIASPLSAADIKIKDYQATAEMKDGSISVQIKIVPKSSEPIKKLTLNARKAGDAKISNVAVAVNGQALSLEVSEKEHMWANRTVMSYIIDQNLAEPLADGGEITVSYSVESAADNGNLKIPLFIAPWKFEQAGMPFQATLKLPKGQYYQGKSMPISYKVETSGDGESVAFRNLNPPAGLYVEIGNEPAGFFTWGVNWTITMFVLIILITFFYLRYELGQIKGRAA